MSNESTKTSARSKNRKTRISINVWIIIGVVIIIYLLVRFCTYFFGNTTSLYEVVAGSSEGRFNTQYTALVLRDETVIDSVKTGYINFFIGDATPINVGAQTYVIDESGELSARLEEASRNQTILNENELRQIRSEERRVGKECRSRIPSMTLIQHTILIITTTPIISNTSCSLRSSI